MATILSLKRRNAISEKGGNAIDHKVISRTRRVIDESLMQPAENDIIIEVVDDHTPDPIKNIDDINRISRYLIANRRYRDNMLFIVGINFGLRVGDLIQLRFCQLINEDLSFKTTFPILETKTKDTRKRKRNRYISINDAVMDSIVLYLENTAIPVKLDDYLFVNESNNNLSNTKHPHLTRQSVDRILKGIGTDLSLGIKIATHSLRKTFGYHQMLISNNDPRKLLLLQRMFGHSTSAQTLDYIGITGEEIEQAYTSLNLGNRQGYLVDSTIEEEVVGYTA